MVEQILFVRTQGNVWGVVWRICILMLGSKGLDYSSPARIIAFLNLQPQDKNYKRFQSNEASKNFSNGDKTK